ncbi:MAG: transcription termination factor Rho, partial [Paraglaciecola sp.]
MFFKTKGGSMPTKYLKLAIFAAATLSFSALSYAQSEQGETKQAEAEERMQQMVDERCGDDEKCQQRMRDKFSEKRNERSNGREERGDRGDRSDRGDRGDRGERGDRTERGDKAKNKNKSKNGREERRQEMLEKRCGEDR